MVIRPHHEYVEEPVSIRVSGIFSDDFLVHVGLHRDLVLSPLFIIVQQALSREIRPGCPEELLMQVTWYLLVQKVRA